MAKTDEVVNLKFKFNDQETKRQLYLVVGVGLGVLMFPLYNCMDTQSHKV